MLRIGYVGVPNRDATINKYTRFLERFGFETVYIDVDELRIPIGLDAIIFQTSQASHNAFQHVKTFCKENSVRMFTTSNGVSEIKSSFAEWLMKDMVEQSELTRVIYATLLNKFGYEPFDRHEYNTIAEAYIDLGYQHSIETNAFYNSLRQIKLMDSVRRGTWQFLKRPSEFNLPARYMERMDVQKLKSLPIDVVETKPVPKPVPKPATKPVPVKPKIVSSDEIIFDSMAQLEKSINSLKSDLHDVKQLQLNNFGAIINLLEKLVRANTALEEIERLKKLFASV